MKNSKMNQIKPENSACMPSRNLPACPDCGAIDCDRAFSSAHECSSGFLPGGRKVCDICGRMNCPSLFDKR